eukprot:ctg_325.g86
MDRDVAVLSGGELQRFAIAVVCLQRADVYMLDEPSSYLDVRQRLRAARAIRSLCRPDNYVLVVEHDLAVLDYLSDFICVLYGMPGAYGVVTYPFSVREGINVFLAGFVPTENMRFRDAELTFKVAEGAAEDVAAVDADKQRRYAYSPLRKTLGKFVLEVERGEFTDSEIILALGRNGTGKTTLVRILAGLLQPDAPDDPDATDSVQVPQLNVSYKPQKISPHVPAPAVPDRRAETAHGGRAVRPGGEASIGRRAAAGGAGAGAGQTGGCVFAGRAVRLPRLRAAHRGRQGDQAVYPARQEDGVHRGARLYHGHLPGRPGDRVRGRTGQARHRLCAAVVGERHEPVFAGVGHYLPPRPDQHATAHQQARFGERSGTEGERQLLFRRDVGAVGGTSERRPRESAQRRCR